MTKLTLTMAESMIDAARVKARELNLKPLGIAVLDAGGHLKAFVAEDGSSFLRPKVAHGKAYGALALGIGSRAIMVRAEQQAFFVNAVNGLTDGALVPVPGGVLMRDDDGELVGAMGISGDTSDNDEACCVAGIEAVGMIPQVS